MKRLLFSVILLSNYVLISAQNIEWAKCYGGTGFDMANSVQQTTDGGYIIAGSSTSTDGDVHGNHSTYIADFWIVKLNVNGDTLWTKCYGGSDRDFAQSIQQTTDDGYIVAGETFSTDGDVHGNHDTTNTNPDWWILKLDANGDTIWTRCYGGTDLDLAQSIQQTTDGGYIVAGETFSTDGDVHGRTCDQNCWILKLDINGDTL